MDEKKPEQRAVICVYCNIGIPYSSDESKDKIYKLMKEHDKICQCNPLVAENERLKEAIELLLCHVAGCWCKTYGMEKGKCSRCQAELALKGE